MIMILKTSAYHMELKKRDTSEVRYHMWQLVYYSYLMFLKKISTTLRKYTGGMCTLKKSGLGNGHNPKIRGLREWEQPKKMGVLRTDFVKSGSYEFMLHQREFLST